MDETNDPILSAAFVGKNPDCTTEDIPFMPLLHVDWVDSEWTGWDIVTVILMEEPPIRRSNLGIL